MRINLPNQITLGRLALAVVFFALLSLFDATKLDGQRWLLLVCFWIFLAAAVGDVLDGLLARLLKQVTPFGRIVDPVVDKVMICGAFIYFASGPFWANGRNITDVQPWMVIVVLVRELLVSAIRSYSEAGGSDFSATWSGKVKMFVQCTTVCVILGQLGWRLDGLAPLRTTCVWATVIVTIISAVFYVRRAREFILSSSALSAAPPRSSPPTAPPSPARDVIIEQPGAPTRFSEATR